jgi:tripartite-type tricarboxylate transporter receptor subunit TctC
MHLLFLRTKEPVRIVALATTIAAAMLPSAFAQADGPYPNKPIKIVVGFGSGSATDVLARIIADPLAKALGQPVIVENRPSAGATIGSEVVSRAKPDGYTLLLGASSAMAVAPAGLVKNLTYDPIKSFTPLWRMSKINYVVMGSTKLPAKNIGEFIAYTRKNPDKVNCASGNATGIAFCELLESHLGVNLLSVPYKSTPAAVMDLLGDQVHVMLVDATNATPRIKSGQLIPYAVPAAERSVLLPDLPTLAETGIKIPELLGWWAMWGPANLPKPIADRLSQELSRIVDDQAIQKKMQAAALEPFSGSPTEVNDYLTKDLNAWTKIIKDYNLAPQN